MQKAQLRAAGISSTIARAEQLAPASHGGAASEIFLTENELAARHRRSAKTLQNARVKGGFIPFVRIGRNVRYPTLGSAGLRGSQFSRIDERRYRWHGASLSNRFQARPPFASNTEPSGRDESGRMSAR